jgi:hypothetical protein
LVFASENALGETEYFLDFWSKKKKPSRRTLKVRGGEKFKN